MTATYGKQFDFYTTVSTEEFPLDMFVKEEPVDGRPYLSLAGREEWFRCRYPHGKVETRTILLDKDQAVVMARVYTDVADAENEFLSCVTVQRTRAEWGRKYYDAAMNGAMARALGAAGYGNPVMLKHQDVGPMLQVPPYLDEADVEHIIALRGSRVQESRQRTAA